MDSTRRNTVHDHVDQLDSPILNERLAALESLYELELRGRLQRSRKVGPELPRYDHVHTTASYGRVVPGVFSVAHMAWAAHESRSESLFIVEHESLAHLDEAQWAVEVVNRGKNRPLRLHLGIEFKARIATRDDASRQFSKNILEAWGQDESAWVVGVGAKFSPGLASLVVRFQKAKRQLAKQQLEKLNRHLHLSPPLMLSKLLTLEGNVTDRMISFAAAKAGWPDADERARIIHARDVRAMLNPGGAAHVPFSFDLPSYQTMIGILRNFGMVPTFTSQLRGQVLEETLPLLKSWGIGGLDVAGIEPDELNAEAQIRRVIELADRHGLALFGGSDYRGVGTGWVKHAEWMDHPRFRP